MLLKLQQPLYGVAKTLQSLPMHVSFRVLPPETVKLLQENGYEELKVMLDYFLRR